MFQETCTLLGIRKTKTTLTYTFSQMEWRKDFMPPKKQTWRCTVLSGLSFLDSWNRQSPATRGINTTRWINVWLTPNPLTTVEDYVRSLGERLSPLYSPVDTSTTLRVLEWRIGMIRKEDLMRVVQSGCTFPCDVRVLLSLWEGPYSVVVKGIHDTIYRIQKGDRTKIEIVHIDPLDFYQRIETAEDDWC